jgi:hypothetical protein
MYYSFIYSFIYKYENNEITPYYSILQLNVGIQKADVRVNHPGAYPDLSRANEQNLIPQDDDTCY